MIDKELSEIIDALTRESGDSMPPCQELELLGFDPFGRLRGIKGTAMLLGADDEEEAESDSYIDEEYEFDEDDERYSLLAQVLRLNNCRKKYFA